MPSNNERFFQLKSFAVISNSELKPFPKLTFNNLRKLGKQVFPVDMGGARSVDGVPAYAALVDLPEQVEGVILELPRGKVLEVVKQVDERQIKHLWLHQGSDSPEVVQFCRDNSINLRRGTCAVMYTQQGLSYHSIHKGIMKLLKKY